ncbi:EAL domain-containing protein [Deinococcus metalli]|nr:EAL domain-containing protein [Deinococcus metalli]GHF49836.1 GGDEF domain-containing protein [Deinococcus metalli]
MPVPTSTTALQSALSDLLRVHAPQATLLASIGEEVLRVRADATSNVVGADLVPPDDWFERGEMTWLTRDGALLGLLWSEDGQVPVTAVQVLTMLLAAARVDGANREAEVLVTQLPVATAWLSVDLTFRRVSRPFLELFGLTDAQLVGRSLSQVFPDRPGLLAGLAQAAAGRSVRLTDERFERAGTVLWARGEARSYFGGASAGVMLTLQDVTGEYDRSARIAALLDTDSPAALLTDTGIVLNASQGLIELCPPSASAAPGAPLWAWPCFADLPSEAVRDLVKLAASGGSARADVALASGERLPLSVRRSSEPGLLVAEGLSARRDGQVPSGMIGQVLAQSEDATVLIDAAGRAQIVSERAAQLLGVEASRLVGLGLTRVLGELGVRTFTTEGDPLTLPEWRDLRLPLKRELLLALPDGGLRHMEVRAATLDTDAGSVLLTLRDLTALRRAQAKVRHNARHDALTGLLNRVGLREAMTAQTSARSTVACLDIDGFGSLNAALGRTACDRLLIQAAARLHDVAEAHGGHAARLTDDTFVVTFPGLDAAAATQAVQETLRAPLRAGQRDVPLTYALGLVTPRGAVTPDAALGDAEIAMQHAKRQGRAQVRAYDPGMRAQVARAFELEDALRGAVAGGQFTMLYQPVTDLKSGGALGAEALLRWNHPALGVLPPSQFLPLAGHSDLITQISAWVIEHALSGRQTIRTALPERFSAWQVSVNLGLEELRRSAGLHGVQALLHEHGAPDIEVAAGSLLDHSQDTLGLLEQLRTLGAQLSVDDFGDGASSLSALTRFPLSAVKLHPTLTARLPDDRRSLALVQGATDLAHRLGLKVVAVGVETSEQLEVLADLGCDAAQGYAICPPLALPDLLKWLQAH